MRYCKILFFVSILFLFGACSSPEPNFDFELSQKTSPITVTFNNTSKNAKSYVWDFGDGQSSTETSPTHTYNFWGNYTVRLTAISGDKQETFSKTFVIEKPKRRKVDIKTSYGTMRVELFNFTPKHRDNFIKLIEDGYYTDLLFHRIIKGFMIQGGDPDSKNAPLSQVLGNGGPGYEIDAEIVPGAYHFKGALAAARRGQGNYEKKSSGSQFYLVQGTLQQDYQVDNAQRQTGITYAANQRKYYREVGGVPFLDGNYTIFGQIIEGLHVLDQIAGVKTGDADRPIEDIKMTIEVVE